MQLTIEPSPSLRGVLYIEDNAPNIALVERLVARHGNLHFESATNGHRGVELARVLVPVVIVMDIQLPDMNGFDVLKRLREIPSIAHIPVMALSSDVYLRQIERGLEAGFCQYLTKPFKITDFIDALDACIACADEQADAPMASLANPPPKPVWRAATPPTK
jgi:CheY-like chemotaxis protein